LFGPFRLGLIDWLADPIRATFKWFPFY
jgi:hypothetical protein